jgi:hypothetical protein
MPEQPEMTYHWVIVVDGQPMDIRGTTDLAVRQAKVRVNRQKDACVQLHYAMAKAVLRHDPRIGLAHDIIAEIGPKTLIAIVHPD